LSVERKFVLKELKDRTQNSALQEQLETLSESDLRQAAEAVVDAAIWRQKLRSDILGGRGDISEPTRQALIELLYRDPSHTPYLFTDEAWERH
jgi:hypothetical protein